MESVGDILGEKGRTVHTTRSTATVLEAVQLMAAKHIGALVVSVDDRPVGILSERDIMMRVILERRDPATTAVGDVMTREVVCIESATRGEEAMAIMTERRCRHLPVMRGGHVEGMISIGDLVRCASREHEFEIRMLTEYVSTGAFAGTPAANH